MSLVAVKPKVYHCVGVSGCGKSAWAENFSKENPNTIVLSRDLYRYEAFKYRSFVDNHHKERAVTFQMLTDLELAMRNNLNVVIADTGLTEATRCHWLRYRDLYNFDLHFVVFKSQFDNMFSDAMSILDLPYYVATEQHARFTRFLNEEPKKNVKYIFV